MKQCEAIYNLVLKQMKQFQHIEVIYVHWILFIIWKSSISNELLYSYGFSSKGFPVKLFKILLHKLNSNCVVGISWKQNEWYYLESIDFRVTTFQRSSIYCFFVSTWFDRNDVFARQTIG